MRCRDCNGDLNERGFGPNVEYKDIMLNGSIDRYLICYTCSKAREANKQDRMVEDWEIEKIPECTTGAEFVMKK